jgi:hypothetical protein
MALECYESKQSGNFSKTRTVDIGCGKEHASSVQLVFVPLKGEENQRMNARERLLM